MEKEELKKLHSAIHSRGQPATKQSSLFVKESWPLTLVKVKTFWSLVEWTSCCVCGARTCMSMSSIFILIFSLYSYLLYFDTMSDKFQIHIKVLYMLVVFYILKMSGVQQEFWKVTKHLLLTSVLPRKRDTFSLCPETTLPRWGNYPKWEDFIKLTPTPVKI